MRADGCLLAGHGHGAGIAADQSGRRCFGKVRCAVVFKLRFGGPRNPDRLGRDRHGNASRRGFAARADRLIPHIIRCGIRAGRNGFAPVGGRRGGAARAERVLHRTVRRCACGGERLCAASIGQRIRRGRSGHRGSRNRNRHGNASRRGLAAGADRFIPYVIGRGIRAGGNAFAPVGGRRGGATRAEGILHRAVRRRTGGNERLCAAGIGQRIRRGRSDHRGSRRGSGFRNNSITGFQLSTAGCQRSDQSVSIDSVVA